MKKSWRYALLALLALPVACGSAAGGMLDDAGHALIDAGAALDGSADAQTAPGAWVDVVCDQERVVTRTSDLQTTVNVTHYALVEGDPASIQMEVCTTQHDSYDADGDGCEDVLSDGSTCGSTGPLPTTCFYGVDAQAVPDGRLYFWCGVTSDVMPVDPTIVPTRHETIRRIRYRHVSL